MANDAKKKDVRNLLQAAEYDIRAAKDLLRVTSHDQTESLMCHVAHAIAKCQEACDLITPEEQLAELRDFKHEMDMLSHPEEDESQARFEFDPAINPNGSMPSEEVHGS